MKLDFVMKSCIVVATPEDSLSFLLVARQACVDYLVVAYRGC